MKSYLQFLVLVFFAGPSCIPLTLQQSSGICKTGDGDVNTYNVIGVWKKVPVTEEEKLNYSELNFKLLYIVSGGVDTVVDGGVLDKIKVYYSNSMCEKAVSGGRPVEVTKAGVFYYDDGRDRIRAALVDLEKEETEPTENWIEYSFSGNCGSTVLTLTYRADGTNALIRKERYNFFSENAPENSCSFN